MADLYHNRVLELAANIPNLGTLSACDASVEKVSRVCGSSVRVDIALSQDGQSIAAIAVNPQACALGQAATSILSEHAVSASIDEVRQARNDLNDMLKKGAEPPQGRFWELRHLAGVRDYPPRHASTMLAFDAAVSAIAKACEATSA